MEIKIYSTNRIDKDFRTYRKYFTQFYFKNYLNKKLGKKIIESYQSIILDNENDLQDNNHNALLDKEFYFVKIIVTVFVYL